MSLIDNLLTVLASYSGGYRPRRQRMRGYPPEPKRQAKNYLEIKENTLRKTFSRLKARGLAENREGNWFITKKGKEYISRKLSDPFRHQGGYSQTLRARPKTMIIAFDIPESKRRCRAWLRAELRLLGFEPLQKSVWLGPAPLPKEFIKALNGLSLLAYLKFFRASEVDVV